VSSNDAREGPDFTESNRDPDELDEDDEETGSSIITSYISNVIEKLNSKSETEIKSRVSQGYLWYHPPNPLIVSARARKDELSSDPFCYPTVSS
jgi:hypothetical protein